MRQSTTLTPAAPTSYLQAVGMVDEDGSRYLLGDAAGRLSMLVLGRERDRVANIAITQLGAS